MLTANPHSQHRALGHTARGHLPPKRPEGRGGRGGSKGKHKPQSPETLDVEAAAAREGPSGQQ